MEKEDILFRSFRERMTDEDDKLMKELIEHLFEEAWSRTRRFKTSMSMVI